MSNCIEHVKKNIAIWRLINTEGKELDREVKLEILNQVNKWLLSDRIQSERNRYNNVKKY